MMRREDYLVWFLIFSTNLMAGAQNTGSLNVQVNSVENNPSCVDVSWQPADSAQYTVNCNGTRIDKTSSPQQVCRNYQPYTLVQCSVSGGTSGTGSGWTACAKPSLPTFKVKDEVGYVALTDGTSVMRRKIIVYDVAVENINCGSISKVLVEVHRTSDGKFIDLSGSVGLDESYKIDNLDAVTRYRVVVEVINDGVDNKNNFITAEKYITTGELPPGPVGDLSVSGTDPGCVEANWTEPQQPRGTIVTYTVNCTQEGQTDAETKNSTSIPTEVCGFDYLKNFSCSVAAINREFIGTYISTSGMTPCGVPSPPTFNLYTNRSSDEKTINLIVNNITVEPNCVSISEIIITVLNDNQQVDSKTLNSNQTSCTFSNLDAVTDYTVNIVAVDSENRQSVNSNSIMTGELAPAGPPDGFKLNFNSSCVILDWSEPLKPNGIILNYMVSCLDQKITLQAMKDENSVRYTFCELPSATQVNCSVSANNSIGWSPSALSSGYTAPKPTEVLQPAKITPKRKVLEVEINAVSFTRKDLNVQHYQFVVESVGSTMRKKRDVSAVDVNKLFNADRAADEKLSYYVAGRISDQTGETIKFRCGDNNMYEGFHNKELKHNFQYKIHYTYTVKLGGKDETYLVESTAIHKLKPPPYYIIGIIVPLFIIIAIIVLVVLYKRNVISWTKTQSNISQKASKIQYHYYAVGQQLLRLLQPNQVWLNLKTTNTEGKCVHGLI